MIIKEINYQVGNLEKSRFEALRKSGVTDSKIMATDTRLWHGTSEKAERQKIDEVFFKDIYTLFQEPENIYEEKKKDKAYRTFHFLKDTKDGKKLKAVFYTKRLKDSLTALQLTTMGHGNYEYTDKGKYEKIW
jgi:formylmethanofuran dehydrogenase subunit E